MQEPFERVDFGQDAGSSVCWTEGATSGDHPNDQHVRDALEARARAARPERETRARAAAERETRARVTGATMPLRALILVFAVWPAYGCFQPDPGAPSLSVSAEPPLPPPEAAEPDPMRRAERDLLLADLRDGSRSRQIRAERVLRRHFADDPVVIEALSLEPRPTSVEVDRQGGAIADPGPPGAQSVLLGVRTGTASDGRPFEVTTFRFDQGALEGTLAFPIADGVSESLALRGIVADGVGELTTPDGAILVRVEAHATTVTMLE
jgi:hypothetical protein